jgi:hypothetical protein
MKPFAILTVVSAAASLSAGAAITATPLGTAPPPAPILPEARAEGTGVTSVPTPLGDITFDQTLTIAEIGSSWATWSHGFAGKVYTTDLFAPLPVTTLTIDLPAGVVGFFVYVEPNNFAPYSISAEAQGGGPLVQLVDGFEGASGFLFNATSGDFIDFVKITVPAGADGFAIGELGIVPEGETVLAGGVLAAAAFGLWLKRRRA